MVTSNYGRNALTTDPRVNIFSGTDPSVDDTQRLTSYHDQTNGVIETGSGGLQLAPANSQVIIPTGLVGAPSLMISGDVDTGLYQVSANSMGFTAGGVNQMTVANSGVTLHGNVTMGTQEVVEDGGAINVLNMPVSATPVAGTEESFTWQIDQIDHLIVYSEADSSGGLQNSSIRAEVRFEENQGADIASATNIAVGTDGNAFEITGTTQVDLISNLGFRDGSIITLICNENVTIGDAVATSGTNVTILLAGSANFGCTADDMLTLMLSSTTATGQAWREVSRSAN